MKTWSLQNQWKKKYHKCFSRGEYDIVEITLLFISVSVTLLFIPVSVTGKEIFQCQKPLSVNTWNTGRINYKVEVWRKFTAGHERRFIYNEWKTISSKSLSNICHRSPFPLTFSSAICGKKWIMRVKIICKRYQVFSINIKNYWRKASVCTWNIPLFIISVSCLTELTNELKWTCIWWGDDI